MMMDRGIEMYRSFQIHLGIEHMCNYWLYVVNICKMYGTHSFKTNVIICKQFN